MLIFNAERKSLCDAILRVSQGLPSRPVNQVLAGMLISAENGKITITASDGEVSFRAAIPGIVHSPGSAVILSGRVFAEFSKYFTGDSVVIETDEHDFAATVMTGKSRFTMPASPGGAYPAWLSPPEPLGKMPAEIFSAAVRYVASAASPIDPILRGMRLEMIASSLEMVCTDRNRMSCAIPQFTAVTLTGDIKGFAPASPVLAPAGVLERFSHVAAEEVSVGWNSSLLGLGTEGISMTVPLISGDLIKGWQMIREEYEPRVTADAGELLRMIKMAALAAGKQGTVNLAFTRSVLTVSASGDASCSDQCELSGNMEPRELEFNPEYLLDALTGDRVSLALTRALIIGTPTGKTMIQPRRKVT